MAKWADFLITAVRFNACGTHIDSLQVRRDYGTMVGDFEVYFREAVVDAVKKGTTYCTVTVDGRNKYQQGQQVFIVTIGETDYLKTYRDSTTRDNLDDLPTF